MKKFFVIILISFLISNISKADFKSVKKKAIINNPEIIFPIPENPNRCITNMYVNKENNPVLPVIKLKLHLVMASIIDLCML